MHNKMSSMNTVITYLPLNIKSLLLYQSYLSSLSYGELVDIIMMSNKVVFIP